MERINRIEICAGLMNNLGLDNTDPYVIEVINEYEDKAFNNRLAGIWDRLISETEYAVDAKELPSAFSGTMREAILKNLILARAATCRIEDEFRQCVPGADDPSDRSKNPSSRLMAILNHAIARNARIRDAHQYAFHAVSERFTQEALVRASTSVAIAIERMKEEYPDFDLTKNLGAGDDYQLVFNQLLFRLSQMGLDEVNQTFMVYLETYYKAREIFCNSSETYTPQERREASDFIVNVQTEMQYCMRDVHEERFSYPTSIVRDQERLTHERAMDVRINVLRKRLRALTIELDQLVADQKVDALVASSPDA